MAVLQDAGGQQEERDTMPRLPVSLSNEINLATRTLHTSLNHLITSRLPLALPPHTNDTTLYTTGLLHFAHVFLTFESLWADLLRDYATSISRPTFPQSSSRRGSGSISPPMSPLLSYLLVNPYDSPSLFTSTLGAPTPPSPELAAFLQTLRPRGTIRSGRLKRDLEHLLGLHPTDLEVLLAKYPGDKVADFCTHIRKCVNEKPWTLVSYAWCFYMAVFSGGRWIRAGLLKAPAGFWPANENKKIGLEDRGLSFWHFPSSFDGEDIKAQFKLRLAAAEDLFTPDERVDIIEEAKAIFEQCLTLVDELDSTIAAHLLTSDIKTPEPVQEFEHDEKRFLIDNKRKKVRSGHVVKSSDKIMTFARRPEVTGMLVALGCLACVTLMKLQ